MKKVSWVEYVCADGSHGFIRGKKIPKYEILAMEKEHGKVKILRVVLA